MSDVDNTFGQPSPEEARVIKAMGRYAVEAGECFSAFSELITKQVETYIEEGYNKLTDIYPNITLKDKVCIREALLHTVNGALGDALSAVESMENTLGLFGPLVPGRTAAIAVSKGYLNQEKIVLQMWEEVNS